MAQKCWKFPPPAGGRLRTTRALNQALAELKSYDWILFSNPIGIEFFFAHFFQTYDDLRELGNVRLGAYGPMTAQKLREWRLHPAAVAADHKTPLIMEAITECGDVRGQRFLVLRGESAWEKVPEALAESGAIVDAWSAMPLNRK